MDKEKIKPKNNHNILDSLPDSLWMSILHEWIGAAPALCAFDTALCNVVLREIYLLCLENKSWKNIHFQSRKKEKIDISSSHKNMLLKREGKCPCMSEKFFDWCLKRNYSPTSLSMHFHSHPILMKQQNYWEILSSVETLKDCCDLNTKTPLSISNVLNQFPKLKYFDVSCRFEYVKSYNKKSFPNYTFHFQYPIYPLCYLELHKTLFPPRIAEFETLIQVCPNLRIVKIIDCYGLCLQHIVYLINHAKQLTTVHYRAAVCDIPADQMPTTLLRPDGDKISIVSTSMDCLTLELNEREKDPMSLHTSEDVCAILRHCSCITKLLLRDFHIEPLNFGYSPLARIISTNWKHLKVLELSGSGVSKELIQCIDNACAQSLQILHLCPWPWQDSTMAILAESFPYLRALYFCIDHHTTTEDDEDGEIGREEGDEALRSNTLIGYLINHAVFRNSLQALILPEVMTSDERITNSILVAFPHLQSLDMQNIALKM